MPYAPPLSPLSYLPRLPCSSALASNFLLPPLLPSSHKGSSSHTLTIAGSELYSGAPFFSLKSQSQVGVDLQSFYSPSYSDCGIVIKASCPEVCVYKSVNSDFLSRGRIYDSVLVGPGLGRDYDVVNQLAFDFNLLYPINDDCDSKDKEKVIPFVFDADALYPHPSSSSPEHGRLLLPSEININNGEHPVILTPNYMEFKRLEEYYKTYPVLHPVPTENANGNEDNTGIDEETLTNIRRVLTLLSKTPFAAIILKSRVDIIATITPIPEPPYYEYDVITCNVEGSMKRCGGIGDVLSGVVSVLCGWFYKGLARVDGVGEQVKLADALYFSCAITRRASKMTWDLKNRAMIATNILGFIADARGEVFEEDFK